jgi:hypothetical protein
MTPLDGILVPTLGAFYLAVTLLFPFVAIRAVGQDKQTGAAKLVEQFPVGTATLLAVKTLAVGAAWCLAALPALSAVAIWSLLGGHLYVPELVNLLLGHALYGFAITGIAFRSGDCRFRGHGRHCRSGFYSRFLGAHFAAGSVQPSWLQALSQMSLTAALRQFEHGLFSLPHPGSSKHRRDADRCRRRLAACWAKAPAQNRPDRRSRRRAGSAIGGSRTGRHLSRCLRGSPQQFCTGRRSGAGRMDKGLTITLYLSPDDSRFKDIETNVLGKLRRQVPRHVRLGEAGRVGLYGSSGDDRYGLVVYEYAGKREEAAPATRGKSCPSCTGWQVLRSCRRRR